jgi:O-methyltransferase
VSTLAVRRKLALVSARFSRRMASKVGVLGDLGGAWSVPPDCDPRTAAIIDRVQAYTLTPPARLMALCEGIRNLDRNGVPGAIVECGVWRGGSMMAAALTLLELGNTDREIWLYDTFTKMPEFGEHDALASGHDLGQVYEQIGDDPIYEIYSEERIRKLMVSTGYPEGKLRLIKGMVEDTIPAQAPGQIALCRLDTDFYESTRHELEQLYPRVSRGGLVIVDDYGEFLGARKAVDEFIARLDPVPLLHRVDFSCRQLVVA